MNRRAPCVSAADRLRGGSGALGSLYARDPALARSAIAQTQVTWGAFGASAASGHPRHAVPRDVALSPMQRSEAD